jgi:hypothetical protein
MSDDLEPLDIDPHGQRMCSRCSQWVVVEKTTKYHVLLSCGHWMNIAEWKGCFVRIKGIRSKRAER